LTGFGLFVTIGDDVGVYRYELTLHPVSWLLWKSKGDITMRRLLFFTGFVAGAFLVWYYLNNLQTQRAQPGHLAEHIPLPSQPVPPSEVTPETTPQVEAYCVKCKVRRVMQNPYATTTQTGRPAVRGTCPVCGSKMFKMGHL
jgi:hypothetical protein